MRKQVLSPSDFLKQLTAAGVAADGHTAQDAIHIPRSPLHLGDASHLVPTFLEFLWEAGPHNIWTLGFGLLILPPDHSFLVVHTDDPIQEASSRVIAASDTRDPAAFAQRIFEKLMRTRANAFRISCLIEALPTRISNVDPKILSRKIIFEGFQAWIDQAEESPDVCWSPGGDLGNRTCGEYFEEVYSEALLQ